MAKSKERFPKEVYVRREIDGKESYLIIEGEDTTEGVTVGFPIARYVLANIGTCTQEPPKFKASVKF